jgi:exodeoxyribonuclease VII large subunit
MPTIVAFLRPKVTSAAYPQPAMTLFNEESAAVRRVSLVRLAGEIARSAAALGRFAVEGEVVRPTSHPGGIYFTLKDRAAQLPVRCPAARLARCRAVTGERVLVTGSLTWLNDRGVLQLVAEEVVPVGAGAIAALLTETRARLRADGLLDRPRRALPLLPAMIGVVCGTEAAVRADIESVVVARFAGYPVDFVPTNVSGPGAADAIAEAVRGLDRRPEIEVIILARGGGDAAQLLPWSDEALCRALSACETPVVSAIGHEGDRPLCDEVADLRCGTPSLAAGAVVPSRLELWQALDAVAQLAHQLTARRVELAAHRLDRIAPAPALHRALALTTARCQRAGARLELTHPSRRIEAARAALGASRRHLEALDPVRVLERGYAVVRGPDGHVVRDASGVAKGDAIDVRLAAGRITAVVEAAG